MNQQLMVFVIVGGATLMAFAVGIALWFAPTVLAARALLSSYPKNAIVIAQKSPDLAAGLARASLTSVGSLPAYFIVMANSTGVVFLKSEDSLPLATVSSETIVGIRAMTIALPRPSNGLAIECVLSDGSKAFLPFVPGRRGGGLWPAPPDQLDALLHSFSKAVGKPILS